MPGEFLLTQAATVQLTNRSLRAQGIRSTRPAGTLCEWDWLSFRRQRLPHQDHSVFCSHVYLTDYLHLQKHQLLNKLFIKRLAPCFLISNTDFQDISSNKSEVGVNKQARHYIKLVNYAPSYTVLEVHTILGAHRR